MCSSEWPDWERVMYYVALIFRHFEGGSSPNQTISPILPIPQGTSPMSPCISLRSSITIPTILCSPLQTV